MTTRTIAFVTGGNNGIGYEIVKALLQSLTSYHIIMGSRSVERGNVAIASLRDKCPQTTNTVEVLQLDLTSDESIQRAVEHVEDSYGGVDVLVHNAGKPQLELDSRPLLSLVAKSVQFVSEIESSYPVLRLVNTLPLCPGRWPGPPLLVLLSDIFLAAAFDALHIAGKVSLRESFTQAYEVNVAGTHVFTWAMTALLLRSSDPRLIFVTGLSSINQASRSYFPTPPMAPGWPKTLDFETIGYRCSKVALNMLMLDWNHKLKADRVKVWAVSPGFCVTDLGGMARDVVETMGASHPSVGANVVRNVVEGESDQDTGKIVGRDGVLDW